MESALYGIFTLVGFVSEIERVSAANSFDFRYFTNSCENPYARAFHEVISIYLFFSSCAGGIQQIWQSDWFLERAEFSNMDR